ncbi:MAG: divergent polysaccharide deacetylase family protein [Pseudomonadota bacterium]
MAREKKTKKEKTELSAKSVIKDLADEWLMFLSPAGTTLQMYFGGLLLSVVGFLVIFSFVDPPETFDITEISAQIPPNFFREADLLDQTQGPVQPAQVGVTNEDGERTDLPPVPEGFSELLLPHPDPVLVENSRFGLLPIIGADGRESWFAYGRPTDVFDIRPRISVIIANLGFSIAVMERIFDLPPGISLAFSPYSDNLSSKINDARGFGFEVLMMLPMEPSNYPLDDPGYLTLLTSEDEDETIQKLHTVMSRATGYVGVLNHMGDAFIVQDEAMTNVLGELKKRGVAFIDNGNSLLSKVPQLSQRLAAPFVVADKHITDVVSVTEFDDVLLEIEAIANENGSAILIIDPIPNLIQPLKTWLQNLPERDLSLTPVSGIIRNSTSLFNQIN